jgi:Domain of unknown function (DUF4864)
MLCSRQEVRPAAEAMNSGFNLVRWMLVVTLGCSLGLLLVFVVVSTRALPRDDEQLAMLRRGRATEPLFELSNETMEGQLRGVIQSQLAAFRQDDYPRAYTYASAAVKAQVALPAFERMVKLGYPLIAQSRSAQFGVTFDNGEQAVVNVVIVGRSGHARHYRYILQKEGTSWKVFGVAEVNFAGMTI